MSLFKNVTFGLLKLLLGGVPNVRLETRRWQQDAKQMISLFRILVEHYNQKLVGARLPPDWAIDDCVVLHEIGALRQCVRWQIYVSSLFHFPGKVPSEFSPTLLEVLPQLVRIK
jgi:hypothetical protein